MRFLMLPLGIGRGLAHLGACVSVGEELRRRGHEVTIGYGGDLPSLEPYTDLPATPVLELPKDPADRHIWDWYGDGEDVARYVDSDLAAIERTKPDAIVADTRFSATIAAEAAGVPQVELMHFLALTEHAEPLPSSPRWRRPHRALMSLAQRLRLAPAMDARLRQVIGDCRVRYGLGPAPTIWPRNGFVACTTTPELDPAPSLPADWGYVGPIIWSIPGNGSGEIVRGERPLVYVSQGTSGSARLLRRAVRDLAKADVDVLVTCGGLCDPEELQSVATNVKAFDYLPGRACLEAADVAVVHGGHITASEAHRAGVPLVVVPYTYEQWSWAARAERLGTGIALPAPRMPGAIGHAVRQILAGTEHRRAAQRVAEHLRDWDGSQRAADAAERLAAG
jgi:MGT family glycosyltransferase